MAGRQPPRPPPTTTQGQPAMHGQPRPRMPAPRPPYTHAHAQQQQQQQQHGTGSPMYGRPPHPGAPQGQQRFPAPQGARPVMRPGQRAGYRSVMSSVFKDFLNKFCQETGKPINAENKKYLRRIFRYASSLVKSEADMDLFHERTKELISIAIAIAKDIKELPRLTEYIRNKSGQEKKTMSQSQTQAEDIAGNIYTREEIKRYLDQQQAAKVSAPAPKGVTAPPTTAQHAPKRTAAQAGKTGPKQQQPAKAAKMPKAGKKHGGRLKRPQASRSSARGAKSSKTGGKKKDDKDQDHDKDLLDVAGVNEDEEEQNLLSHQQYIGQRVRKGDVDRSVFTRADVMPFVERIVPAHLGANAQVDTAVFTALTLALDEYVLDIFSKARRRAKRSVKVPFRQRSQHHALLEGAMLDPASAPTPLWPTNGSQSTTAGATDAGGGSGGGSNPSTTRGARDTSGSGTVNGAHRAPPNGLVRTPVIREAHVRALCMRSVPHSRARFMFRHLVGLSSKAVPHTR